MSCSTPNCTKKVLARGLCKSCYRKQPDQAEKARARNLVRYHTDPAYHEAHLAAKKRRYYAKTPEQKERNREYMREYIKQPEKRAQKNEYDRARWADPEKREKIRNQKRLLTCFFPEHLIHACRTLQSGRCAICLRTLTPGQGSTAEHADHCHTTNTPRGLLCAVCNLGLGGYEKHQKPHGLILAPYEDYLANPPVSRITQG